MLIAPGTLDLFSHSDVHPRILLNTFRRTDAVFGGAQWKLVRMVVGIHKIHPRLRGMTQILAKGLHMY